jgi:hypothetical protein
MNHGDDQRYLRIRLESEAAQLILKLFDSVPDSKQVFRLTRACLPDRENPIREKNLEIQANETIRY